MARKTQIQIRRDTAANWTATNPVLASGELGFETDTGKFKMGDGATAWAGLSYAGGGGGTGTISDLTSTGGTITVGSPTGPTTNVDLPASGVTASTYGSSSNVPQITVDAEGRITAAANVGIGGGVVVGADGWVDDTAETWTFASFAAGPPAVGTFTVSGDVRSKYPVGTRIKLTQTTVKYFVVTAAPTFAGGNTTVTISGGTDYTLANAAISANFHSYVVNPQGYPTWFNFDGGVTGFSGTPAKNLVFKVDGNACTIHIYINGTSNATTLGFTLPVAPDAANYPIALVGNVINGGTFQSTPGSIQLTSIATAIQLLMNAGGVAWSNTGTKRWWGQGTYKV